jgi:RNA 3'-terminal phosphate cyclase (ATP)
VLAAAKVGRAEISGAALGSREFSFVPGAIVPGEYKFAIGTAGSTTLVLQTILPPLMLASGPSTITLEGGTHNIKAPPFEFLEQSFVPLINRFGPKVTGELLRYGFYPPGGGRIQVSIQPVPMLRPFDLNEFDPIRSRRAKALLVNLPAHIGERELSVLRERLEWPAEDLSVETSRSSISPGNVFTIAIEREELTEIITAIGERGVRAETIAERAVDEAVKYLGHGAPVGEHLADQLLIPMALAGGGSFTTGPLSLHTTTNIEIIQQFLDVTFLLTQTADDNWRIEVRRDAG